MSKRRSTPSRGRRNHLHDEGQNSMFDNPETAQAPGQSEPHPPRQESDANVQPWNATHLERVVWPEGVSAWMVRLSELDRLLEGYAIPTPPDELEQITWTVLATSPEAAAVGYAARYDALIRSISIPYAAGQWVEVWPADQPDAEPMLFHVTGRMIPYYTASEALESDVHQYQELLNQWIAYALRRSHG